LDSIVFPLSIRPELHAWELLPRGDRPTADYTQKKSYRDKKLLGNPKRTGHHAYWTDKTDRQTDGQTADRQILHRITSAYSLFFPVLFIFSIFFFKKNYVFPLLSLYFTLYFARRRHKSARAEREKQTESRMSDEDVPDDSVFSSSFFFSLPGYLGFLFLFSP